MIPSAHALAFAVHLNKTKPSHLSVKEYIAGLVPHVREQNGQYSFDPAAYWRRRCREAEQRNVELASGPSGSTQEVVAIVTRMLMNQGETEEESRNLSNSLSSNPLATSREEDAASSHHQGNTITPTAGNVLTSQMVQGLDVSIFHKVNTNLLTALKHLHMLTQSPSSSTPTQTPNHQNNHHHFLHATRATADAIALLPDTLTSPPHDNPQLKNHITWLQNALSKCTSSLQNLYTTLSPQTDNSPLLTPALTTLFTTTLKALQRSILHTLTYPCDPPSLCPSIPDIVSALLTRLLSFTPSQTLNPRGFHQAALYHLVIRASQLIQMQAVPTDSSTKAAAIESRYLLPLVVRALQGCSHGEDTSLARCARARYRQLLWASVLGELPTDEKGNELEVPLWADVMTDVDGDVRSMEEDEEKGVWLLGELARVMGVDLVLEGL